MSQRDLVILVEGLFYGAILTLILERVVFPLSFRLSRALDRFHPRA